MEKRRGIKKERVVVFGIFDGVHEGHRFLFSQARAFGTDLVAVVGRDDFVRKFKHKEPRNNEKHRVEMVQKEPLVDKAVLGDEQASSWNILEQLKPDVICLGYDQDALEKDLNLWMADHGASIAVVHALYKNPTDKV